MKDNLFGTSGIRGVVNEDINPELFLNLSKSIAMELGDRGEIIIGRDARPSGKLFEDALIGGFLSAGFDVEIVGTVPTPVLAFSVSELNADAGIMITASHNPPQYNGFKLFNSKGMAISPKKEKEIENKYLNKDFKASKWKNIGKLKYKDVLENYLVKIAGKVSLKRKYKVIIDCANGPTSKTTPSLLEKLGCEVATINSDLDGKSPSRPPEPTEENIQDLIGLVKTTNADLGIAHDGDGDRIAVVDENGQFVDQDKLLALIGSYYVKKFRGGIVCTVDTSKIVEEQISKIGGRVVKTEVGDVPVVQEMSSQNFKFGGEPSGTLIHGDFNMCPDGTSAAIKILEVLDNRKEKFSELINSIPNYTTKRTKIPCREEDKQDKINRVRKRLNYTFEGIKEIINVDGVRIEFENGDWILIRPSGTEPYIRITAESSEEKEAEILLEKGKNIVKGN